MIMDSDCVSANMKFFRIKVRLSILQKSFKYKYPSDFIWLLSAVLGI